MSRMTSVVSLAKMRMAPPTPVDTMAALAFTRPSRELSVEARGRDWPLGYTVRYRSEPWGTTVTLMEYANAVMGTPQALFGMTMSRALCPGMAGPSNGPSGFRVSAIRQGFTVTN